MTKPIISLTPAGTSFLMVAARHGRNFKRHMNKGEKGIRMLAPAPYKRNEGRDKLDPVIGRLCSVGE